MPWLAGLETPQDALAVLTAMITPAVLISACGALIFSTSTRMGRVVDRVRVGRTSVQYRVRAHGLVVNADPEAVLFGTTITFVSVDEDGNKVPIGGQAPP